MCRCVWPVKVDLANKAANEELRPAATLGIIPGIGVALPSNETRKLITKPRKDFERTRALARRGGCHHSSLHTLSLFFLSHSQFALFISHLLSFSLSLTLSPFNYIFILICSLSFPFFSSHPCTLFLSYTLLLPHPQITFSPSHISGWCGDVVVSTVASQKECPGFDPWIASGFPPDAPVSSHIPSIVVKWLL